MLCNTTLAAVAIRISCERAPSGFNHLLSRRPKKMKAIWNGKTVAESDDTVIVEGNHYFPAESIHPEYFEDSQTHTTCGWKGIASYKSLSADGKTNPDAAWYYPDPKPAAANIAGRFAFWKGVEVL
jgi:uncharacterized protein (DUF427 family)